MIDRSGKNQTTNE